MNKRSGVSIGDVAARAGVSAQTVSRVARGEDTVRPKTADHVRRVMAELGYVPNQAARALRSGATNTIGLVGHRLTRTGEARIMEAVVTRLHEAGYATMLMDVPTSNAADFSRALVSLGHSVDGLVVLRLETPQPEDVRLPTTLPLVLGDSRHAEGHTVVGTDQAGGTRQAVEHLLGLGHRTVHHVTGPSTSIQAQEREEAWRHTLWDAGREAPPVVVGDWTPASGYAAGRRLLDMPGVSAVFCGNDEMAMGVLRAFHEAGRRVPDDVSVVGFDDVSAEWMWPPLTTVAQDFAGVGRALVDALLLELGDDPARHDQILVPATLVVRESTAAPR